jgi:hypothetical protein
VNHEKLEDEIAIELKHEAATLPPNTRFQPIPS